jgi:hypothetical protein
MTIPADARRQVIQRAKDRCEYCGLSQAGQEALFHVDHVVPVTVGGMTTLDNLALACDSCSLRKGARREAPDPTTGKDLPLFHPRRDVWSRHFRWDGVRILGLSPTGRATVAALSMNRSLALAIRREETIRGRHPPSSAR